MNERVERFLIQALAACGFTVLDAPLALSLRPDIFVSANTAGGAWSEAWPRLELFLANLGAALFLVRIAGREEPLRVAARSDYQLPDRIQAILGLRVISVEPVRTFRAEAPAQPQGAAAEPDSVPAWPCRDRAEAFTGSRDPKFGTPPRSSTGVFNKGG